MNFSEELNQQLKNTAKDLGTTKADLIRALVEFGLDHADFSCLEVEAAKPRGRKKGSTYTRQASAPAVATSNNDVIIPPFADDFDDLDDPREVSY